MRDGDLPTLPYRGAVIETPAPTSARPRNTIWFWIGFVLVIAICLVAIVLSAASMDYGGM